MNSENTQHVPAFRRLSDALRRHPALLVVIVCTVLAALAFSAFGDALNCSFITFDDPLYVFDNANVTAGLSLKSVAWAFTTTKNANWHPLTWLSHMLDVELFGLESRGHHFTSLFIHTLNALLCLWLFWLITGSKWQGALIALFFAVHPLRAESVVWVAERKDVLCVFFGLASLIAYIQYAQHRKPAAYIFASLFLLLGLLSKSMLVTWPFVFLLLDYWPLNRFAAVRLNQPRTVWPLVREKLPFFLLVLLFCITAYFAQSTQGAVRHTQEFPIALRLQNISVSYVRYLGKLFWPTRLSIFYPVTLGLLTIANVIASLLALAAVTLAAFKLRAKYPFLLVGWLWFVGTLVPVIGLVHIGYQSMADRYTYLPGLGILLMLIPLAAALYKKSKPAKFPLTAAAVLAACALLFASWVQTGYWKNSLTLYRHAAEVTRTNPVIWLFYGRELQRNRHYDLALEQYQKIMDYSPDRPDPWLLIGKLYLASKQYDNARAHLQKAHEKFGDSSPELLAQLAQLALETGNPADARQWLDKAIQSADRLGASALKDQYLQMQIDLPAE